MATLTAAFAILMSLSNVAFSAEWFLVRVEKSGLYNAVAAHRVEATLVQASDHLVRLWVRTDYLRPKNYKYPSRPRLGAGNVIATDSYLWEKTRYTVSCPTQQLTADEGSYMLAREQIEFEGGKPHSVAVSPDTIFEVIYRIACNDGKPRSLHEMRTFASALEAVLVPDKSKQEQIREEKTAPQFLI